MNIMAIFVCLGISFFGMEEFYSYKEKLYKKDKAGKQNTPTQQQKIK